MQPKYTVAGLFESGQLGNADETALEEIKRLRNAFTQYLNPSRGWMTPRYGSSAPEMPRTLGDRAAWQRYTDWRKRWAWCLVAPSPNIPWGLTAADVVIALALDPITFEELAEHTGRSALQLAELFVRACRDYGRTVPLSKLPDNSRRMRRLWRDARGTYRSARVPTDRERRRRVQGRDRVRRFRERARAAA